MRQCIKVHPHHQNSLTYSWKLGQNNFRFSPVSYHGPRIKVSNRWLGHFFSVVLIQRILDLGLSRPRASCHRLDRATAAEDRERRPQLPGSQQQSHGRFHGRQSFRSFPEVLEVVSSPQALEFWCQFRQHFMTRFCAQNPFAKKIQTQIVSTLKLRKKPFIRKSCS